MPIPPRTRGSRLAALIAAGAVLLTAGAELARGAPPAGLQAPRSEQFGRADYKIDVRLEEEGLAPDAGDDEGAGVQKELHGALVLTWTNHTQVATDELWFHLYWNAFANTGSTHLRPSGGRLRGESLENGWGWQRVTAVRAAGQDLMPSFRYRSPDDGNPDDRTVFSVVTPQPVGPGQTLQVEIEWQARIPRVRRRTGFKGDFLFIAHWFPKLGVFEGARGWNAHQFHASTEFYSNYGTYDVTLDLPARYDNKIGATGVAVSPSERRDGRVRTRFLAPSMSDRSRPDSTGRLPLVHDFTWTADTKFKARRSTFSYELWKNEHPEEVERVQRILGKGKDLSLRSVAVTVLMQPEREQQWKRHYDATCTALFFYGLWFGAYPYENVTVVDPAWGAGAAGGMEYPMLFTAGTRLYAPPGSYTPESVTVHEAGHQFFYGLIGSNEFEAAWLDEGFNSYADSEALVRRYGPRLGTTDYAGLPFLGVHTVPAPGGNAFADALSARRIPLPLLSFRFSPLGSGSGFLDAWRDQPHLTLSPQPSDPRWADRSSYLADPERDPVDTFGWLYADGASYRTNSYARTAVALRSLSGVVGHDAFLRGMRHYAETWRYRHPYPDDFFQAFQQGAGVDVGWYFDSVFRSTQSVDWSVNVEQRAVSAPAGFTQPKPGAAFELLHGSAPAPAPAPVEDAILAEGTDGAPAAQPGRPEGEKWAANVMVARKGELRLPLTIELRYDDGSTERRTWSREEQASSHWMRIEHRGPRKLAAVVLDPERLYFLDKDMSNNRWFAERDTRTPVRWAERAFQRYLHLLHWQAGLGG